MNILSAVPILGEIIDKVIPDKDKREEYKYRLEVIAKQGDIDNQLAQIAVNLADARSGNWFQSNWRPAIGWTCMLGLGNAVLVVPYIASATPVPTGLLLSVLGALLGIGGLRTFEKLKGVNTK